MEPSSAEHFISIRSVEEVLAKAQENFVRIKKVFDELNSTRVMELLRHNKERAKYLLNYHCKVIATPADILLLNQEELLEAKHKVGTLIFLEAGKLTDFECFAGIVASRGPKRLVLIGDQMENPPFITSRLHHYTAGLGRSMFARLSKLNYPKISLHQQFSVTLGVHKASKLLYNDFELVHPLEMEVPGIQQTFQVVNVACREVRQVYAARSVEQALPEPGRGGVRGGAVHVPGAARCQAAAGVDLHGHEGAGGPGAGDLGEEGLVAQEFRHAADSGLRGRQRVPAERLRDCLARALVVSRPRGPR
jgi:hypothetical protein